jgi:hypothetical protein
MQASYSQSVQPHTREIIAPSNCSTFTREQEAALDVAYMAWVDSGYRVAEGEKYAALRRKFQYENMARGL